MQSLDLHLIGSVKKTLEILKVKSCRTINIYLVNFPLRVWRNCETLNNVLNNNAKLLQSTLYKYQIISLMYDISSLNSVYR